MRNPTEVLQEMLTSSESYMTERMKENHGKKKKWVCIREGNSRAIS